MLKNPYGTGSPLESPLTGLLTGIALSQNPFNRAPTICEPCIIFAPLSVPNSAPLLHGLLQRAVDEDHT